MATPQSPENSYDLWVGVAMQAQPPRSVRPKSEFEKKMDTLIQNDPFRQEIFEDAYNNLHKVNGVFLTLEEIWGMRGGKKRIKSLFTSPSLS